LKSDPSGSLPREGRAGEGLPRVHGAPYFNEVAMNRFGPATIATFLLAISPLAACAEQEVTLQSGVTLIGDVTFDGDAIVVDIEGAKQRVPLADVESVTPTGFGPEREARRLLLAALEARQLGGPPREALALLTEAARLDPDNPQIAFWHAGTLVDAGLGKAASRTFESHREAIDAAYPDGAPKLAERIRMRTLLEMLPPDMVQRIDALNAAAAVQPANATVRPMAAAFRVLDQYKDPVDKTAFQIYVSGDDESLEPYADGYYLYTFTRRREGSDQPCRLNITQYGFKAEQHEFRASSARVAIAGEFLAHRYGEVDKRPVRAVVRDRDGGPLADVRVVLQPNGSGNGNTGELGGTTDAQGRMTVSALPGAYSYRVMLDGYSDASGSCQINDAAAENAELQVVLHRSIDAKLRVAWAATPLHAGAPPGVGGAGEETLEINASSRPAPSGPSLNPARIMQEGDNMVVQFDTFPFYATGMPGAVAPWFKKQSAPTQEDAKGDDASGDADARFAAVDLSKVADLDDDFVSVPLQGAGPGPGQGQPTVHVPAKDGDLFVGQFVSRDRRTGQPVNYTIKALVTEMPKAASATE
jgi:hypothetical protein